VREPLNSFIIIIIIITIIQSPIKSEQIIKISINNTEQKKAPEIVFQWPKYIFECFTTDARGTSLCQKQ